jgi:NADH pyrophosphatase NudC (nudix superfamily)
MNYCSNCGEKVTELIPQGDDRLRHVCEACTTVHYQNPKIVAGCIPVWENRLLLCRRAIEPRHGLWTLPAGFMENGESTEQAAARETREEACATVKQQIPWEELAFPVVRLTLEHYFKDLESNHFPVHVEDIHHHPARQG